MIIFLLFGLFVSQDLSLPGSPKYSDIVVKIRDQYAKELKQVYNIKTFGTGSGFEEGVYSTSLYLIIEKPANIDEARKLYVGIIENLLYRINHDKRMATYVKDKPLTYENIDLNLSIQKNDSSEYPKNSISAVFKKKNIIYYDITDPDNPNLYKDFHQETYEEALKILKDQSTSKK